MKAGRPTAKRPEVVDKIMDLARQGKIDEEIAHIVGVSSRTLRSWKVNDWEFSSALKENKDLADDLVEASTFKNAVGFTYTEEAATKEGVQTLERYQAPNATSQIFWLKNRRPEVWKDRVEVTVGPSQRLIIRAADKTKLLEN